MVAREVLEGASYEDDMTVAAWAAMDFDPTRVKHTERISAYKVNTAAPYTGKYVVDVVAWVPLEVRAFLPNQPDTDMQ